MGQLSLDSATGGGETIICRLTPSGRIDVQPGASEDGCPSRKFDPRKKH